jgi:8-oxo-dGTP diphosphatase
VTAAIYAAGAVCWRLVDGKVRILVVRRTKYGDVSLPKGKVDPGETLPQTAMREVEEETGLKVSLGVPLGVTQYRIASGRDKFVYYWAAEVDEKAAAKSTFTPNGEIAAIEWVTLRKARGYLSYERDVEVLDVFASLVDRGVAGTFAIIALRHAKAAPREAWNRSDSERPLTERGVKQAVSDVPTLRVWGPQKIITSPAVRCISTVAPLAAATGLKPKYEPRISQDAYESGDSDVRGVVLKRIQKRKNAVLCSHGPVLPDILREIALATDSPTGAYLSDASALETGGFSVVHLSRTDPGAGIVTIETYAPIV